MSQVKMEDVTPAVVKPPSLEEEPIETTASSEPPKKLAFHRAFLLGLVKARAAWLRRRLRLITIGGASTVVLLVGGWFVLGLFMAKTEVGPVRLASWSNDQVYSQALAKQADGYRLTVKTPDKKQVSYGLKDLGMSVDTAQSIGQIRAQQHTFKSRVVWWQPTRVAASVNVNDTALNNFIANKTTIIAQPSKDATLSIDSGKITVSDAVTGKQYGLSDSRSTLVARVQTLTPSAISLHQLAVNPALTAKMLEPYKAKLEKIIAQPISFTVQGTTLTPKPADIAAWLDITPEPKTKTVDIAVNSGKVAAFIDTISKAYIHPAKAKITTAAPDGTVKTLVDGQNGVAVTNKSSVSTAVANGVLAAKVNPQNLAVSFENFKTINTGDYPKWIEADLTNKRMYAYEHGTLVRTQLVTAGAPKTPTVTGQYKILSKFAQQTMRGRNADGSNYVQPNVRWVNYFYQDYAIHGNYWRPLSYFGNINSSHGCVSTTNDEAKWMYDWAPIGTPVIVHN